MTRPPDSLNRRSRRDEAGQVGVIFALCLVTVVGASGMAVDYASLSSARASLQAATDAAALEGAKALALSVGQNAGQRERAAVSTAQAVVDGRMPEVVAAVSATTSGDTVTVRASATRALVFRGLLGQDTAEIGVSSSATYTGGRAACVIALSPTAPTGFEVSGSAAVSAPRCSIWSNAAGPASVRFGASTKTVARRVCAVGGRSGQGAVSPAPETGCDPFPDPFADRTIPASGSCDHLSTSIPSSQTTILAPGVYCGGLRIEGNVTLAPGLYVVRDGVLAIAGKARVEGTGVSLLLMGTATMNWTGAGRVSLSAMTSGPLAGIVIASDPNGPEGTSSTQGDISLSLDGSFTGAIYLPRQKLTITGSSDLRLMGDRDKVVAALIEVTGSGRLSVDADDVPELRATWGGLRLTR